DELHEALLLMGVMTGEEAQRVTAESSALLDSLAAQKRAGRLVGAPAFHVAAERLPMVQAVFPECKIEPPVTPPGLEFKNAWERAGGVGELIGGRMEVIGPITATALTSFFALSRGEIDGALLALEAEGFLLRGRFHPDATELEWCDRRLLARIHRLTINR